MKLVITHAIVIMWLLALQRSREDSPGVSERNFTHSKKSKPERAHTLTIQLVIQIYVAVTGQALGGSDV